MTPASFKAAFTVFDGEDTATIQRGIDASENVFDVTRWGDLYEDGLGFWLADWLVNDKRDRAGGPSPSAGDVISASFATPAGQQSQTRDAGSMAYERLNPEAGTRWGRKYLVLRDRVGLGGTAA